MSINDQVKAIDKQSFEIIQQLELSIRPLARAIDTVLDTFGRIRGYRFLGRRRREYKHGELLILRCIAMFKDNDIQVYYQNHLVLKFDHMLPLMDLKDFARRKYLFVYKPGPWEQAIVREYRRVKLGNLEHNYDVDPEYCDWFDHNEGGCGKDDRECPCPEYKHETQEAKS